MSLQIFFLITLFFGVRSAPVETQNSTEAATTTTTTVEAKPQQSYDLSQFDEVYDQKQNVWTPPGNLLTAAMLLDPALTDPMFSEDNLKSAQKGPSTNKSEEPSRPKADKRRLRIPGFLRPFVRRHHANP